MRSVKRRWGSRTSASLVGAALVSVGGLAHADQPIAVQETWTGHLDFFATGSSLAADGPDGDTNLDMLAQPGSVDVMVPDVPPLGEVRAAYLYWGGSITNSECTDATAIDDMVDFTPPGGVITAVMADACYCSVAGSMSYDVQGCVAEVTGLVTTLEGTYVVDDFAAYINNGTTHNASFSIVLVYAEPSLPPRRIALYDGLLTMSVDTNPEQVITLGGLDVDAPPSGDLTWYVLEGDVGGSSGEGAEVTGLPGGTSILLSDAINPVGNPMNHTINTTTPTQPDAVGVDIDQFALDAALDPADTAVEVRLTAGVDKWWLIYDIVGVNVFEPVLSDASVKDWTLWTDADGSGTPTPGDTIRYTLHVENTGNADGVVAIDDPMPAEAASWTLVDAAGGTDASVGDTLVLTDLLLPVGGSVDVVVDIVLADVPEGTMVVNTAEYTAEPGGVHGFMVAMPVVVGAAVGGSGSDSGGSSGGADTGDSTGTGAVDSTGTGAASSGGATAGASTGSSGAAETTGGSPPSADTGTSDGAAGGVADPGCGCRSDASPRLGWLGLLGLLGLRRRRDRRRVQAA